MVSLQVSSLTKHYGKVRALHNVSFGVQAGEIFGYLGPNGAGKTTTLRIVVGLVHADGGEVRLFDRSIRRANERMAVGYLPRETLVIRWMENLWRCFALCSSSVSVLRLGDSSGGTFREVIRRDTSDTLEKETEQRISS